MRGKSKQFDYDVNDYTLGTKFLSKECSDSRYLFFCVVKILAFCSQLGRIYIYQLFFYLEWRNWAYSRNINCGLGQKTHFDLALYKKKKK